MSNVTRKLTLPNPPHAMVRIYPKKLKQNGYSVYLDYTVRGVRHQECMHIYLSDDTKLKGENKKEVQRTNLQNITKAMQLRAQKEKELLKQCLEIENNSKDILLSQYLNNFIEESDKCRKGSSYARTLENVRSHLQIFLGDNYKSFTINEVTPTFCRKFIDYFRKAIKRNKKPLSPNSSSHYIKFFRSFLDNAVKEDMLICNPFSKLKKFEFISKKENLRSSLTEKELKQLQDADCPNENVSKAFFFSCYTGLRLSDIRALQWGSLKLSAQESYMQIVMKKTDRPLIMKLSPKAIQHLPDSIGPKETKVFSLPSRTNLSHIMKKWVEKSRLTKNITYHTSRHTFGTMLAARGVNIQTIQKLMGHRCITSTSFYVEVTDKAKEEAIDLL